jgi:uridine kinase
MQAQRIVVAVAGGSGSGKTAVVNQAIRRLKGKICLVDQDSYFFSMGDGSGNFDVPHAIDHALLSEHIATLKSGRGIAKPKYSFATHQRTAETDFLDSAPIIVLEGLFAYWDQKVRAACDLKILIDAPPDLRFIRRLQRDLRERERTIESTISQYLETVRPMHEKYSGVMREHADVIVMNDGDFELPVAAIVEEVQRRRGAGSESVAGH